MSFVLGLFVGIGSAFVFLIIVALIFEIPERRTLLENVARIVDNLDNIDNTLQQRLYHGR